MIGLRLAIILSITGVGDVTMGVTIDKSTYLPGQTVQLQAVLSQGGQLIGGDHVSGGTPISNATVQASVIVPGSATPDSVTFVPKGNGLYLASFTNTTAKGTYDFTVVARGTYNTAGGVFSVPQTFTRQTRQSVYVSPPFIGNAALVGIDSISIQDSAVIRSGSAIVNTKKGRLTVGVGATTPARYSLKANSIVVLSGAVVASDIYFNQLTNAGTLGGSKFTPLSTFPLVQLPPFESAKTGSLSINVATGTTAALAPGSYLDVTLQPSSTLIMSGGGAYDIRNLWVKSKANLVFTGAAHVHVLYGFRAENTAYVGPAQGSTVSPPDIILYVGGTNSQSPFSNAASIAPAADVFANI